jgi:hypothetical protein
MSIAITFKLNGLSWQLNLMWLQTNFAIKLKLNKGESRVAGESRKSCALGCGRALLWNALPVARAALGARWKDPTPELQKVLSTLSKS